MSWWLDELVIVPLRDGVSALASDTALLAVCDQNTEEWHNARLGIPTGSTAATLVTPKGKVREGAAVDKFAYELAMDRVYGRDLDGYESRAMEMGRIIEPEARAAWEALRGISVEQVGFVYHDDSKRWGCSPDGLFETGGSFGVLEIKSLQRRAICDFMSQGDDFEIPKDHYLQLIFNMWCCGATIGVYIVYFSSSRPILLERKVAIDDVLVAGFEKALPDFSDKIGKAEARFREIGKN